MVFKKMLGAFGVGGPSVDTVLSQPGAQPGAPLTGQVNLIGGSTEAAIEHITLGLVTRMEVETGDGDHHATGEFHRLTVSGPLHLAAGQHLSLPFQLVLPWETPITAVYGQPLHGMVMGVRTEVSIARAVDKGDLDAVQVYPLPVQQRILDAFNRLGFVFKSADLEYGQIAGVHQTLPFYQEIEFFPPQQWAQAVNEVELTFVTSPHQVDVILEFDKRSDMFGGGGHDSFGRYTVSHADADTTDWAGVVDGWVRQAVEHRQSLPGYAPPSPYGPPGHGQPAFAQPGYAETGHAQLGHAQLGHAQSGQPGYGQPAYGQPGQPAYGQPGFGQPAYGHSGHGQPGYGPEHGHGHYPQQHHGGGGSGMGGVAMGVVGGLAAGYVASEIMDEVFDDEDGGDEGED
ncbi:sporulation protein [Actinoplanes subglobosus]|uniref:Sporulation protein n=1 Tax=Actinoplanes subglobosus TaxID=1547892 RepID=A0ABV8J6J4_9ACTN